MKRDIEQELLYINKLKGVLTQNWIDLQFKVLYEKSQLKERAKFLNLLHPFTRDYLDVQTSIRKAVILGKDILIAGEGYFNSVNVGKNLFELQGLYDEDKLRTRLQDKKQYDDVCWELDVAVCLKHTGFDIKFVEESDEASYDLFASYNGHDIAIECKNKHNEDEEYTTNKTFASCFTKDVFNVWCDLNRDKYDVRISIIHGTGALEDIKKVNLLIRDMFLSKSKKSICNNQYEIEFINDYKGIPTPVVLERFGEEMCMNTRVVADLKDIYDKTKNNGTSYEDRIFFRFPPQDLELKSIKALISKANKQINGIQGCVFLKAPMINFDEAIQQTKKILLKDFTNIGGVKVISLQNSFSESYGVKTERNEEFIIHSRPKIQINKAIAATLSKNIYFNKYYSNR